MESCWSEIVKWGIGGIFGVAMLGMMFKGMRWGMRTVEGLVRDFKDVNKTLMDHHEEGGREWRGALERNTQVLGELNTFLRKKNGSSGEVCLSEDGE